MTDNKPSSADPASRSRQNLDRASAHVWSAWTIANDLTEREEPLADAHSIKLLLDEAAHQIGEAGRALSDLPSPTDPMDHYELGFLDALRSVEHGMREPVPPVVSDRFRVALGRMLAKLRGEQATRESTATA